MSYIVQVLYIGSSVNHYSSRTLLRCFNSSVDLITTEVGRPVIKIILHTALPSITITVSRCYLINGQCAQCTYFHQLQIRMYSCTSSLDLCTIHFIILLWMVVPGLRLDDYVYMYTFIFILRCLPSEYKSTSCAPPTSIAIQTGDAYSSLISGASLSHVLEGVNWLYASAKRWEIWPIN